MARGTYPSDRADRFLVRLPEGMRLRLAERAKLNLRSMNNEVVSILGSILGSPQETTAAGPSPEKAIPAAAPNEPVSASSSTHGY